MFDAGFTSGATGFTTILSNLGFNSCKLSNNDFLFGKSLKRDNNVDCR